jgi:hypothetical protein
MDLEICKKIGDILINKKINDPGLISGKAGVVIFFYNLAEKTSDKKYLKYADLLIDEIYKRFNLNINLRDGIAGTAWCIEYLIQNNFCKGNANEILKEIDTRIFKFLYEHHEIPFDLQYGLIGYLQYIMMRLKNKKTYKSDEVQINIELFKFIINKIDRIAPSQFLNLTKEVRFNLLEDIYILLWSLNEALVLNIYSEKILNMFKQWETHIISYIPGLHINCLYLATILLQTNKLLKSEKINKHINILLYSIDINQLELEIDIQKINNIQLGYLGFLFVLNKGIQVFNSAYLNYEQLIDFKNKITVLYRNKLLNELKESDNTNTQYGIADGWAGVGLLLLLNPNCV